ncbi:aldolase, partial [Streptomyces sp. XM4011]|nr:aldolase [Streptomyces sp. XM4011]
MDQHRARTSIPAATRHEIAASLAGADAHLARHYPGERATRQPVHTVYVPADRFTPGTA